MANSNSYSYLLLQIDFNETLSIKFIPQRERVNITGRIDKMLQEKHNKP